MMYPWVLRMVLYLCKALDKVLAYHEDILAKRKCLAGDESALIERVSLA